MKRPKGDQPPLPSSTSWNLINHSPKSSLKSNILLPPGVPMPVMASPDGFDYHQFVETYRHDSRFPVSNERSTSRPTTPPRRVKAPAKTVPSPCALRESRTGLTTPSANKSIDLQAATVTVRPIFSPITNHSIHQSNTSDTPTSPVKTAVKTQRKPKDRRSKTKSSQGVQEGREVSTLKVPTSEFSNFTATPVPTTLTTSPTSEVQPLPLRKIASSESEEEEEEEKEAGEEVDWLDQYYQEHPSVDSIQSLVSLLDASPASASSSTDKPLSIATSTNDKTSDCRPPLENPSPDLQRELPVIASSNDQKEVPIPAKEKEAKRGNPSQVPSKPAVAEDHPALPKPGAKEVEGIPQEVIDEAWRLSGWNRASTAESESESDVESATVTAKLRPPSCRTQPATLLATQDFDSCEKDHFEGFWDVEGETTRLPPQEAPSAKPGMENGSKTKRKRDAFPRSAAPLPSAPDPSDNHDENLLNEHFSVHTAASSQDGSKSKKTDVSSSTPAAMTIMVTETDPRVSDDVRRTEFSWAVRMNVPAVHDPLETGYYEGLPDSLEIGMTITAVVRLPLPAFPVAMPQDGEPSVPSAQVTIYVSPPTPPDAPKEARYTRAHPTTNMPSYPDQPVFVSPPTPLFRGQVQDVFQVAQHVPSPSTTIPPSASDLSLMITDNPWSRLSVDCFSVNSIPPSPSVHFVHPYARVPEGDNIKQSVVNPLLARQPPPPPSPGFLSPEDALLDGRQGPSLDLQGRVQSMERESSELVVRRLPIEPVTPQVVRHSRMVAARWERDFPVEVDPLLWFKERSAMVGARVESPQPRWPKPASLTRMMDPAPLKEDDSPSDDPPYRPVSPSPAPKSRPRLPLHMMPLGIPGPCINGSKRQPRREPGPGALTDDRSARRNRIKVQVMRFNNTNRLPAEEGEAQVTTKRPVQERAPTTTQRKAFEPAVRFYGFPPFIRDRLYETSVHGSHRGQCDRASDYIPPPPPPPLPSQPCETPRAENWPIAESQHPLDSPKTSTPVSPPTGWELEARSGPLVSSKNDVSPKCPVGRVIRSFSSADELDMEVGSLSEKWVDPRRVGERIGELKEPKDPTLQKGEGEEYVPGESQSAGDCLTPALQWLPVPSPSPCRRIPGAYDFHIVRPQHEQPPTPIPPARRVDPTLPPVEQRRALPIVPRRIIYQPLDEPDPPPPPPIINRLGQWLWALFGFAQ